MKYCPTCQTKYDEEILRFCTKDGSPLIEEDQPDFSELPSETEEDEFGAETVIRRKPPMRQPDTESDDLPSGTARPDNGQRIVIPTSETEQPAPQVRPKTTPSIRMQPPPGARSNTALVVVTTILGTLVVMAGAFGVFYLLSGQNADDANQNMNANFNSLNENLNANLDNLNFDFNLNANGNTNINGEMNLNFNTNLKTPTPSPTPTPTPTATPTPTPTPTPADEEPTPSPTRTQTPRPTPPREPTPTNTPANRPVNGGVLNGRAVSLKTPVYPPDARKMQAAGRVQVRILVDESGNVDTAEAVSGHPLLRSPAEDAARRSKFNPVRVDGRNVQTTGLVVYNFVRPN